MERNSRVSMSEFPYDILNVLKIECSVILGRAIAQAVSRRLPTAAARVRVQVRSCGICGW
jgi:hypothetical protein